MLATHPSPSSLPLHQTATLVTGSNLGDGVMFGQAIAGRNKLPAYE